VIDPLEVGTAQVGTAQVGTVAVVMPLSPVTLAATSD